MKQDDDWKPYRAPLIGIMKRRQQHLAGLRADRIDDNGDPVCTGCGGPAIRDGCHRCAECLKRDDTYN